MNVVLAFAYVVPIAAALVVAACAPYIFPELADMQKHMQPVRT